MGKGPPSTAGCLVERATEASASDCRCLRCQSQSQRIDRGASVDAYQRAWRPPRSKVKVKVKVLRTRR